MILNFSNWSERGVGGGEGLGCLFVREREREHYDLLYEGFVPWAFQMHVFLWVCVNATIILWRFFWFIFWLSPFLIFAG